MSELLGKDFLRCSDKRADLLWAEDWRRRGDPQLLLLLLLLLVVVLVTGIDGAVVAKRLLLMVLVLLIVGTRSVSAGAVVMMARASRAPSADKSIVHVVSLSR